MPEGNSNKAVKIPALLSCSVSKKKKRFKYSLTIAKYILANYIFFRVTFLLIHAAKNFSRWFSIS